MGSTLGLLSLVLGLFAAGAMAQPLTGPSRVCIYCNDADTFRYSCKVAFEENSLECPFREANITIPDCDDSTRFQPGSVCSDPTEGGFDCYASLTEISNREVYRLQDIKKDSPWCPDEYCISTECSLQPPSCKEDDPVVTPECANASEAKLSYDYPTTPEILKACQVLWTPGSVPNRTDPGVGAEIRCRKDSYEVSNGKWESPRPEVCNFVEDAAATVGVTGLTPGCGLYSFCTDPTPIDGVIDIQWVISMEQTYDF
jgi:hypothetical protein